MNLQTSKEGGGNLLEEGSKNVKTCIPGSPVWIWRLGDLKTRGVGVVGNWT